MTRNARTRNDSYGHSGKKHELHDLTDAQIKEIKVALKKEYPDWKFKVCHYLCNTGQHLSIIILESPIDFANAMKKTRRSAHKWMNFPDSFELKEFEAWKTWNWDFPYDGRDDLGRYLRRNPRTFYKLRYKKYPTIIKEISNIESIVKKICPQYTFTEFFKKFFPKKKVNRASMFAHMTIYELYIDYKTSWVEK